MISRSRQCEMQSNQRLRLTFRLFEHSWVTCTESLKDNVFYVFLSGMSKLLIRKNTTFLLFKYLDVRIKIKRTCGGHNLLT